MTTYYPIPYAEYNAIQLHPSTGINAGTQCFNKGEVVFNANDDQLYVCTTDPANPARNSWQTISSSEGWTLTDTTLHTNNTDNDWSVGIGTSTPTIPKLTVIGNKIRLSKNDVPSVVTRVESTNSGSAYLTLEAPSTPIVTTTLQYQWLGGGGSSRVKEIGGWYKDAAGIIHRIPYVSGNNLRNQTLTATINQDITGLGNYVKIQAIYTCAGTYYWYDDATANTDHRQHLCTHSGNSYRWEDLPNGCHWDCNDVLYSLTPTVVTTPTTGTWQFISPTGNSNLSISQYDTGGANQSLLDITSNGTVSIGNSSPNESYKLYVDGKFKANNILAKNITVTGCSQPKCSYSPAVTFDKALSSPSIVCSPGPNNNASYPLLTCWVNSVVTNAALNTTQVSITLTSHESARKLTGVIPVYVSAIEQ
ncbi:MAG: hypothetical protein WC546_03505 [Candidatus Omnitrophota bacterium]